MSSTAPSPTTTTVEPGCTRAACGTAIRRGGNRASFEFALVSAAVALEMDWPRIRQARIALGGVGAKPWRVPRVEAALAGADLNPSTLRGAAALAAESAQGRGGNNFKVQLMQRAIVRAVEIAGART